MPLTMDAWKLLGAIERTYKPNEVFTWGEMRNIAPPCAITPSRNDLALRLVRELIKSGWLQNSKTNLRESTFKLNEEH